MSDNIKRMICIVIVCINFCFLLGLAGSCEIGNISIKSYILKSTIVGLATIIPAYKAGLLE